MLPLLLLLLNIIVTCSSHQCYLPLVRMASDSCFTRCLKCCFWCLETVLRFISKNAYIMVNPSLLCVILCNQNSDICNMCECMSFIENPIFSKKTYEIQGVVLCYILLFENIRNPVFGHSPSFPASSFMPHVTYLQYLTQCGVKPGLYSVRRSTQTELRKRIYADTRIMAFILLRRSRRVCTRIVGLFTLGICAIPTA